MKKLCFYIFILLLGIQSAAGNVVPGNQRIENFVSQQGFYQNTVNSIVSDSKGYLWIATPNGLIRYDGFTFEYSYHDPENEESIPSNFISHLLKDSDGKLWITTRQGMCLYLADKEKFFPLKLDIYNESLIKEDAKKRIWVGSGSKLHVFNSKANNTDLVPKIGTLNLEEALQNKPIQDIAFMTDSQCIVATRSKLYMLNFDETDLGSMNVTSLYFEEKGCEIVKILKSANTIWLGTNNGIFQTFLEKDKLTTIRSFFNSDNENARGSVPVLSMFMDKEDNLWIGTEQNGILRYDAKNSIFISYQHDPKNSNGLTSNRINCFYEDAFGVMWIGTAQGGLNKLDKNQKPFFNFSHNPYDDQSISNNLITDIAEDQEGRVWISFFGNKLCRIKEGVNPEESGTIHFERLTINLEQLNRERIQRIFVDTRGYLWIGTNESLYLYDEKKDVLKEIRLQVKGESEEPPLRRVICQTADDQFLIGGSQMFLLDEPWETILKAGPVEVDEAFIDLGENGLVNDYVKDRFGNYWFATMKGVFRVGNEDGKWQVKNHFTSSTENGGIILSNNNIFTIHINLNKDIWLGSFGGGLMKIQLDPSGKPESIRRYHKKDGLPDEAIYGILEDAQGKFWISTDMGICRFDPWDERFDIYDVNDGILNNNFRQSAYLKTKSGMMLMGGLNGLTVFNPDQITRNEIVPRILISKLRINNQDVVVGNKINNKIILEQAISDTKKLVVNHANRNISLDIIVQHNATPQKNRVAYKLEGFNNDWVELDGGRATATYTNLDAGIYRFLYKGANGDGIWTESTSELVIQVLAPWYLRWWSLTLWGGMIVVMAFVIFKYLVRQGKLEQRLKFEQLDKERVHEMDQAKLRFFTNITHDFKTPLSLIIGPLEKIAEKNKGKEDQKYFSIINNNITRLHRLIDQLISYRKAEAGHLELNYTKTTLGNFIYPLVEAFEENAKHINVNFFYKVISPNTPIVIDIDKTERILLNLFSNAVKFTEQDGEISIEAGFYEKEGKQLLYFEVADSGIGISELQIDKIFDRFYRAVEDRGTWSGTGIGLALCKSLIEIMNGNISVESVQNKRTVFKIELPYDVKAKVEAKEDLNKFRRIVTDWMPAELGEISERSTDTNLQSLLIIDDEKDVRSFLQESFRDKYNVTVAVDGEDGLKKVSECQPQLIISDVMMPKLDGYQLCEKIKTDIKTCHIPVVLLTALETNTDEIKGLENGADAYIRKPFSIGHLEVTVRKLIENRQKIFDYFSDHSILKTNQSLDISTRERKFLEDLSMIILKNMEKSAFGVEELAKEAGMSTSSFYRRLRKLTGQAPSSYLRNFRLQKAAELLQDNSDLNVTEVMFEVGIESASYFASSFKKLYGMTPSEYIKKIRNT